jgi:hypothetical protein
MRHLTRRELFQSARRPPAGTALEQPAKAAPDSSYDWIHSAGIRVPDGRNLRAILLLRGGKELPPALRDAWFHLTLPPVLIHEAIRVDLA